MAGQIAALEKDYPVALIRESLVPNTQLITSNGTDLPTIGVQSFIPLFIAPSKGAVIDFARFRWATNAVATSTIKIRYIADGTAADGSGTQVGSVTSSSGANTFKNMTIDATANRIPGNALVYLDTRTGASSAAAPAGLVADYGYRVLTN